MELESYQIPTSYQGYLETFEKDPELAIERLENHVEKRNTGAVGYFFLAWLYLKNQQLDKAQEAALQAKILAPGSRFFENLHYFIAHPQHFDAWKPPQKRITFKRDLSSETSHPIHNLDSLISKLASAESKRIKINPEGEPESDLSERSSNVDDIVTETLAVIHEKQGNYSAAISTYKKLKEMNPHREEHYDKTIKRLVKKQKDKESS